MLSIRYRFLSIFSDIVIAALFYQLYLLKYKIIYYLIILKVILFLIFPKISILIIFKYIYSYILQVWIANFLPVSPVGGMLQDAGPSGRRPAIAVCVYIYSIVSEFNILHRHRARETASARARGLGQGRPAGGARKRTCAAALCLWWWAAALFLLRLSLYGQVTKRSTQMNTTAVYRYIHTCIGVYIFLGSDSGVHSIFMIYSICWVQVLGRVGEVGILEKINENIVASKEHRKIYTIDHYIILITINKLSFMNS